MQSLVDPNKRIGRLWYLFFTIILYALMTGLSGLERSAHTAYVIVTLLLVYMSICLNKNRLNDCGWSGWWMLIPFSGLVLIFAPGDAGANKYGDAP